MSLGDFNSAARLREIIRTIASEVVEEIYPRPRFATVTAINVTLRTATVQYPDDAATFTIPYGGVTPAVGSIVRVAGRIGSKYIDDVMTGPGVWANLTLQNSWVNYGGGWALAGYSKRDDRVSLRGLVSSGTNNVAMFTLPVGFRPVSYELFGSIASNGAVQHGRIDVFPDGTVLISTETPYNAWVSLSGISFSIA